MYTTPGLVMNTHRIVLGDWSNDGHGDTEEFLFESNRTDEEIMDAYKKACKVLGIALHGADDDIELFGKKLPKRTRRPGDEYKHGFDVGNTAAIKAVTNLKFDDWHGLNYEDFFHVFLWMVGKADPGFSWTPVNKITPVFGFWKKGANIAIGYEVEMEYQK